MAAETREATFLVSLVSSFLVSDDDPASRTFKRSRPEIATCVEYTGSSNIEFTDCRLHVGTRSLLMVPDCLS